MSRICVIAPGTGGGACGTSHALPDLDFACGLATLSLMDGDVTTDFDGVTVVVDRMSVPYLNGAEIDFVDTIEKQGFTIDNPNATGSCACGDSFH